MLVLFGLGGQTTLMQTLSGARGFASNLGIVIDEHDIDICQ
jgi:hypothetical protein